MSVGVDVGTNSLCVAKVDDEGNPIFKLERDAFYRLVPKSEVNRQSIKTSLSKRGVNFIEDDADFLIIGEDALHIAMERNCSSSRPMLNGVISPKDKNSLPMLKVLLSNLVGRGNGSDTLVYSVPAKPVDAVFDIVYHQEMLNMFFRDQGYSPQPINEAFAIGLSELLDDGLTGIALSLGAGMANISVIHQGDPLVEFSVTRSGDFIDHSVGTALDMSPSLIQLEKESGIDLYNPKDKIAEAIAVYYSSVINYVLQNISFELKKQEKRLPIFREPVPIIVSGGLTLAEGFTRMFEERLSGITLPMKISEIRRAASPMTCVAAGCLMASQL
ncbi:MAG TPA: hypothetical protein VI911_08210 [Patescibacteria group bacterium]|nr:hypothetical protein [Patescibacteria group bacterium]